MWITRNGLPCLRSETETSQICYVSATSNSTYIESQTLLVSCFIYIFNTLIYNLGLPRICYSFLFSINIFTLVYTSSYCCKYSVNCSVSICSTAALIVFAIPSNISGNNFAASPGFIPHFFLNAFFACLLFTISPPRTTYKPAA